MEELERLINEIIYLGDTYYTYGGEIPADIKQAKQNLLNYIEQNYAEEKRMKRTTQI